MKRIAIALALLASLGAACGKAGADAPEAQVAAQPVGLADGVMKAAMVEAGLTNFTGLTAVDFSDGRMKAAMVEAGITNFTSGGSK